MHDNWEPSSCSHSVVLYFFSSPVDHIWPALSWILKRVRNNKPKINISRTPQERLTGAGAVREIRVCSEIIVLARAEGGGSGACPAVGGAAGTQAFPLLGFEGARATGCEETNTPEKST